MFTCEIILVAALLSSDNTTHTQEAQAFYDVIKPSILIIGANSQSVAYPTNPNCNKSDDWVSKIQTTYSKIQNFPKVEEAYNFGVSHKQVKQLLLNNCAYQMEITERMKLDVYNQQILENAWCECEQLYAIWSYLETALNQDVYNVVERRYALERLRNLIGDTAFYSGHMPPSLPYWHIPRK